jgi:hypothetical protein
MTRLSLAAFAALIPHIASPALADVTVTIPFAAEIGGKAFLAGAMVDGWEAPALTSLSRAPVPWTETELYRYLRQGHTEAHGIAAGPMGDVVKELRHHGLA